MHRLLGRLGWLLVTLVFVGLVYQLVFPISFRAVALSFGAAGAFLLVVPPVRQAFRNFLLHIEDDDLRGFPSDIKQVVKDLQTKSFIEFSWLDVFFFAIGAIFIGVGYGMEIFHEMHGHAG